MQPRSVSLRHHVHGAATTQDLPHTISAFEMIEVSTQRDRVIENILSIFEALHRTAQLPQLFFWTHVPPVAGPSGPDSSESGMLHPFDSELQRSLPRTVSV